MAKHGNRKMTTKPKTPFFLHEGYRYYPVVTKKGIRLRVHEHKTGKIKKWEDLYRLTLTINYVIHHEYYSMKTTAFGTKKYLESIIDELTERLKDAVADQVGYPESQWWFPTEPSIETEPAGFTYEPKHTFKPSKPKKEYVKRRKRR
jgi:hypothetical protein